MYPETEQMVEPLKFKRYDWRNKTKLNIHATVSLMVIYSWQPHLYASSKPQQVPFSNGPIRALLLVIGYSACIPLLTLTHSTFPLHTPSYPCLLLLTFAYPSLPLLTLAFSCLPLIPVA